MSHEHDLNKVRRDVAAFADDQMIGVVELAAVLMTSPGMIYRLLYTNPTALPAAVAGFGRRRVWHLGKCRDWVRRRAYGETELANSARRLKVGRPRITEETKFPTR